MKKNDVLDFRVLDARGPGLGRDTPGLDRGGDQLQGSDQEGGQLGAASEGEKMWILRLSEQGYLAKVCHGADEAIDLIKAYLDGKWYKKDW